MGLRDAGGGKNYIKGRVNVNRSIIWWINIMIDFEKMLEGLVVVVEGSHARELGRLGDCELRKTRTFIKP